MVNLGWEMSGFCACVGTVGAGGFWASVCPACAGCFERGGGRFCEVDAPSFCSLSEPDGEVFWVEVVAQIGCTGIQ